MAGLNLCGEVEYVKLFIVMTLQKTLWTTNLIISSLMLVSIRTVKTAHPKLYLVKKRT